MRRTTKEAFSRWAAYRANPAANPIPADLRSPIYRAAIKTDPANTVAALKEEWFNTPAIDGKELCLSALSQVTDETIIKENLLPFLFNISPPAPVTDSVPSGDMHYLGSGLAGNRVGRPLLWAYMKENWAQFEAKLAGNPILADRMVKVSLPKFNDWEALEDIEAFFGGGKIDTKAFDRTLEQVKDKIRGRAAYKSRDAEVVKKWLAAEGYA